MRKNMARGWTHGRRARCPEPSSGWLECTSGQAVHDRRARIDEFRLIKRTTLDIDVERPHSRQAEGWWVQTEVGAGYNLVVSA